MFLRGDGDILTGELTDPSGGPYDDAFELPGGELTLRWPGALELTCTTDCKFAVYFDALDNVVALEPQTAPPDWINRDPGVATPEHPRTAMAIWRWRRTSSS
jgi:galactose mutarotase-like enzyme